MSKNREEQDRREFEEIRQKEKRVSTQRKNRQVSHYAQETGDIPVRDDDYHFMVHNVLH